MPQLTGIDFRAAKPWRGLVSIAALLNRIVLRRHTTLDVSPNDLAHFRTLPPGCLIAPNHAHFDDPQVTFDLARRAGRRVIYMATRELFDAWRGLGGWFLQRLGVFSVNRGGPNVQARQFAREILVAGRFDLLMFPEGEIYLLNDMLMPLKPGVARLALEAYQELSVHGRPRHIFIVPVAIKYRYTEDITTALEAATARLETQVLGRPGIGPLYPRIVALGTERLAQSERAKGMTPQPDEGLFERIRRLRRTLLEQLEQKHAGKVQEGFDFDRARKLMIRLQGLLADSARGIGYYELSATPPDDPLMTDLETARLCARSVAFQEDYLLQNPSPERMAETLTKLEREIFGTGTRVFGKRRAAIRIAPPLNVREFLPRDTSTSSLDEAIETVVTRLQESLREALDALAQKESTA